MPRTVALFVPMLILVCTNRLHADVIYNYVSDHAFDVDGGGRIKISDSSYLARQASFADLDSFLWFPYYSGLLDLTSLNNFSATLSPDGTSLVVTASKSFGLNDTYFYMAPSTKPGQDFWREGTDVIENGRGHWQVDPTTVPIVTAPEPSSFALCGVAAVALLSYRRWGRRKTNCG